MLPDFSSFFPPFLSPFYRSAMAPAVTSPLPCAPLPALPRWAEEVHNDEGSDSVDLYANFGGVYIGPPDKDEDPLTSDLTSAGNTNSMDTTCTDGIAEFHRPFEDPADITFIGTHVYAQQRIPAVDKYSPVADVNSTLQRPGGIGITGCYGNVYETFSPSGGMNDRMTSSNYSLSNGGNTTPTAGIQSFMQPSLLD